jgi:hypothetical protein
VTEGEIYEIIENIPDEFKTESLYLAAVQLFGYAVKFVPEKHKTAELCLAAVKRDDGALEYVPEKFAEICREALKAEKQTV